MLPTRSEAGSAAGALCGAEIPGLSSAAEASETNKIFPQVFIDNIV